MKTRIILLLISFGLTGSLQGEPLGLPLVPVPDDNPVTAEKVVLGDKLFHDIRFSSTGTVSCASCHDSEKVFTDSPLATSEGIMKLTGTRNAPTVVNAAYMETMFWDGREPDLEGQSAQPFLNPVEMGLLNHDPILNIVRTDPEYQQMFRNAFGKSGKGITMTEVKQAIASFERTLVSGDSPFDRYYFSGDKEAMNESAVRGFDIFLKQGRCVSCHTINQTYSIFTDNMFHNIGVSFNKIAADVQELASTFSEAKQQGRNVDIEVLTNKNTSELGRFAVTDDWSDMGGFKTPTLRNIELTSPYMHDGSLKTLAEVVSFYNNGGVVNATDPVPDFLSGGIRPLNLDAQQEQDLEEFLKALTSPEYR